MASSITSSTADSKDEPSTPEEDYVKRIIKVLDLDHSSESQRLAYDLLIRGRQALNHYKDDISPDVLERQMNYESSDLLKILEDYIEREWRETITEDWFHQFLAEQTAESSIIYDQILRRKAEYGPKYMKDNPLLSITIQFFFEFDDEAMETDNLFDQIWHRLISEGLQGLKHFRDHLPSEVLQKQLKDEQSALKRALKVHYRPILKDFLQSKPLHISKPEILEVAVDCVTSQGWLKGLNDPKFTKFIAPKKQAILLEKVKEFLRSHAVLTLGDTNDASAQSMTTSDNGKEDLLSNTLFVPSLPIQTIMNSSPPSVSTVSSTSASEITKKVSHNSTSSINDVQQQERQMINTCIEKNEKLKLSDWVNANKFICIDQRFNVIIDGIIQGYRSHNNFSTFIHACFPSIIYLLKRQHKLDEFVENLCLRMILDDAIQKKPHLSLRMIIDILLSSCDLSLSLRIISLLSRRNPVPFLQPSLTDDHSIYRFVSSIIHVWDYSKPTLLSFGLGPCPGKSTLLNRLFFTTFERSLSSIYFQNTIDLDFGYYCLSKRSINIADVHGSITSSLLRHIHHLFHGFLIHVEYSHLLQHHKSVSHDLDIIQSQQRPRLLIIRDVPLDQHDKCSEFLSKHFSTVKTFSLPNVTDVSDRRNRSLISQLRDKVWDQNPTRCRHDVNYLRQELKFLMNKEFQQHFDDISEVIGPLERELANMVENEQRFKRYFPEYLQFVELCRLKLQLTHLHFYGNRNDAETRSIQRKIFELEDQTNKQQSNDHSTIYKLFCEVLRAPQMLSCLELLSTHLKQERVGTKLSENMKKQLPIQQNLSLELLWRNAVVCSQNEPIEIQQRFSEYIQAGFPFEIVDGDNFHISYLFLRHTLESFYSRRTLVISIIGSQYSGKSTLFNHMFGTSFGVRNGRGIYGSFVRTNRTDLDYILLLDTAGALNMKSEDLEYDRRILLFCLAVSHVVIVNMIGEMSKELQSMVTVCADALKKLNVPKIAQPRIHFILNQTADPNIDNNRAALDRLVTDVEKLNLGQSIDIRQESFHSLPSAFKTEGQSLVSNPHIPNVLQMVPAFIERVQLLSEQIICSAMPCFNRSKGFIDPLQWLSSSYVIFCTLQKFAHLTFYRDIHERRLDNEIREFIRNDLMKIGSIEYREDLIRESSDKTEKEINDLLNARRVEVQQMAQKNLDDRCDLIKVPDRLRRQSEQFLHIQISEIFDALRTRVILVSERTKVELFVQNGLDKLQKSVEDIIRSDQQMSRDAAMRRCDQMFDSTLQSINTLFVPNDCLTQVMELIHSSYHSYAKECLLDLQHLKEHQIVVNESGLVIDEVKDDLIIKFTEIGYQQNFVTVDYSHPITSYSTDSIKKLIYLNKDSIGKKFHNYTTQTSSFVDGHRDRSQTINNAMNQFQMQIQDGIRQQKPIQSRKELLAEKSRYFSLSDLFEVSISRVSRALEEVTGQDGSGQMRIELIQEIVGVINSLIADVDRELTPFSLSLSTALKSTVHTCAMVLLSKYYYDEQVSHFTKTLTVLQSKRAALKGYFINMVVHNTSVDEVSATNLLKQFKDHLVKSFTNDKEQIIDKDITNNESLTRKWIQGGCDEQCRNGDDEKSCLAYIENPTTIIESLFEKIWKNGEQKVNEQLAMRKSHYIELLNEFFACIERMLNTVELLCATNRFVNDVFVSEVVNIPDVNQNLLNKQRCMAILIQKYFIEQTIPTSFVHNSETYHLKTEAANAFQLLLDQQKASTELSKVMLPISSIFDRISIGNASVFLRTITKGKDEMLGDLYRRGSDLDNRGAQDRQASMLKKVLGCSSCCPFCNRPCDVDHTQVETPPGSPDNRHGCLSGHGLPAFNGYMLGTGNEPCILRCSSIKDDQAMVFATTTCQWKKLRNDHPDWTLEMNLSDEDSRLFYDKCMMAWSKIGSNLCSKYKMANFS